MTQSGKHVTILIPSLEPDNRLYEYIQELYSNGFHNIIVIDDGSVGDSYKQIFNQIANIPEVVVLHHEVNCGKGTALKTGYKWIMDNDPECYGVISADADGQHTVVDCLKLRKCLESGEFAVYLGSRDFNLPNIPLRSRSGNKITSVVFKALYGKYLPDTQTGLRAFRREELSFMLGVKGERYEYEMNVLIACARANFPMIPVTIETIYENDNAGSHFHPIRDSYKIYKVLLGSFVRYMGSSILSWLIDQSAFDLLCYVVLPKIGGMGVVQLTWSSGLIARCLSSGINYSVNRKLVFNDSGSISSSLWKYVLLCIIVICVSNSCVVFLKSLGVALWLGKPVVDLILYLINFKIQNSWVFSREGCISNK